jgi:hypothetical protein
MKRINNVVSLLTILILILSACQAEQVENTEFIETNNFHNETESTTAEVTTESITTTYLSKAAEKSETEITTEEESDYIRNFVDRYIYPDYNDSVAFYDIDDDGVDEVLRVLMDGSTAHELSFTIYEVTDNEMKETFVFTCLEEENLYFENSLIGNKLCKYYDKEKNQFFWLYNILSIWDGDINVSYRIIKFSFDEDIISADILSETFG